MIMGAARIFSSADTKEVWRYFCLCETRSTVEIENIVLCSFNNPSNVGKICNQVRGACVQTATGRSSNIHLLLSLLQRWRSTERHRQIGIYWILTNLAFCWYSTAYNDILLPPLSGDFTDNFVSALGTFLSLGIHINNASMLLELWISALKQMLSGVMTAPSGVKEMISPDGDGLSLRL